MAYTINKTSGQLLTTLADGSVNDTSTSLTLIGKNYAGYGKLYNENLVKLVENFARGTAPSNPVDGQLWFDSTNKQIRLYHASTGATTEQNWRRLAKVTQGSTTPAEPVAGELWFDLSTANSPKLKIYNSSTTQWLEIGPNFSVSSSGSQTGSTFETLSDGTTDHNVVSFFVDNNRMAIFTSTAFTPSPSITGFTTLATGLNLNSNYATVTGAATQLSESGTGYASTQYARLTKTTSQAFDGPITANAGLTVSAGVTSQLGRVRFDGTTMIAQNDTNNGNVEVKINAGGSTVNGLLINGSNGVLTSYAGINVGTSSTGNVTCGNVVASGSVAVPSVTATANVTAGNVVSRVISAGNAATTGTLTGRWTLTSGSTLEATYADLAERFHADADYATGTVLMMGGDYEVTQADTDASEDVFGIVSDRAAYLLNAQAGPQSTHPAIALQGRVPVRAIGTVRKGARLISAGNGLAREAKSGEATPFNTLGRALEAKETTDEGLVMAIVKLNT